MSKKVAVLAVQGAFIEHERALGKLGCECVELRQGPDVDQAFDALVLPGGESTAQAKMLREWACSIRCATAWPPACRC